MGAVEKLNKTTLIVVMMFFIGGCVQSPTSNNITSVNNPPIQTPVVTSVSFPPTPTLTPIMYHVGETASDGITNITLNGLRYTTVINEKDNLLNMLKAQPGYKYVILEITLEIIKGGEKRSYPQGMSFIVKDSEGYVYRNHKIEYEALRMPLSSAGSIAYGDKLRGELAFEIPENARGLKFQFQFDSDNRTTFKLSD